MGNSNMELDTRLQKLERRLENYQSSIEPKSGEFTGQNWYNTATEVLNVWNGREFTPAYGSSIVKDLEGFETRISQNEYELEFEVLQADNVIAAINLSSEGVNILGDKITLDGDVTVTGSFTLDKINDGTTYGRILTTSITAGKIKLDETVNGTYSKILSTSISAGKILLDETVNGTYAKVLSTYITAGRIELGGLDGDLDDISDGSTYRRTTLNEKTGAGRGYNALNTSSRYKNWLQNSELSTGTNPSNGVILDYNGLRGYRGGAETFKIDTSGNAYFKGDLAADSGYLKTLDIDGTLTMNATTGIIVSSDHSEATGFTEGYKIDDTGFYVGQGKAIRLYYDAALYATHHGYGLVIDNNGISFHSYIGSNNGSLTWQINQNVEILGTTVDIEGITATEALGVEGYLVARGAIICEAGIILNNSSDIYLLGTGNRIKAVNSSGSMIGEIYYSTSLGKWRITDETNGSFYLNP